MPAPIVDFPLDRASVTRSTVLAFSDEANLSRVPTSRGVFAKYPAATPKWTNRGGPAEDNFRDTMARMFIELAPAEYERFLNSVEQGAHSGEGGESRILASVLAGPDATERGTGYIDFLLQDVQMPFEEKTQVIETLADNYVIYYFGQAAVPFTFAGTLLNTIEDDQGVNMMRIYRDMIRGTQLARRRKLLSIRFNRTIVSGSVLRLNIGVTADSEMAMPFNLQLMPKTITFLPNDYFGVEVLPAGEGDDVHAEQAEEARVPTAARFETPLAPENLTGGGATAPVEEENEMSMDPEAEARLYGQTEAGSEPTLPDWGVEESSRRGFSTGARER